MSITDDEFKEFEGLIDPASAKQEVACAKYLQHATMRLFPSFPDVEFIVDLEQRLHFGRSDFLVVGDFVSDLGPKERRVYFWELKAAQCFPFQRDDAATRVRPTTDLIKAETQLIHYVEEARGSAIFTRAFNVLPQNIKMGGIIMGRDNRLWDPETQQLSEASAMVSLKLRIEAVYEPLHIRLLTWDRIAEDLRRNLASLSVPS